MFGIFKKKDIKEIKEEKKEVVVNDYTDLVGRDFNPRQLDPDYVVKRHDVRKRRRLEALKFLGSILQGLFLLGVVVLLFFVVFEKHNPAPLSPPPDRWTQREGFVALSYGGLSLNERPGTRSVSKELFEQHMSALMEAGYRVITTEDVVNYYWHDKPLPDKALYLMFEGGRKDSAIFSQGTIKRHNLRATMYIQTARLAGGNRFFMRATELGVLAKNPYWEIGSQGYELQYINVMDDGGYGFFLTDYLRDRYRNPIESDSDLLVRLAKDYAESFEPLVKYTGHEPSSYVFMPANMLWRSLEGRVEEVNATLLHRYYKVVFAREGPCYNSRETAPFDLTRMQVSSEWSVNRLLAEIEASSPNRHVYQQAAEDQRRLWQTDVGALSSGEESLILTAPASGAALTWLLGSNTWDNVDLSVNFTGASRGTQRVFLRYASSQSNLCVFLERENLVVEERVADRGVSVLFDRWLDFDRNPERLRFTLIGNRLTIRYGAEEIPLTEDPIPVSRTIQRGRVALGALGEEEPYDAVFERLAIRPVAHRWMQPYPDEAEHGGDALYTCAVFPVASGDEAGQGGQAWQEYGPRILYRAVAEGMMTFAALPEENYDMGLLDKPWEKMATGMFPRFLSGVMVAPSATPDWDALERASSAVRDRGMDFAVRLSKEAATALATTDRHPAIDWIVLDFAEPLPEETELKLKVKYDPRHFLKQGNAAMGVVNEWIGEDA